MSSSQEIHCGTEIIEVFCHFPHEMTSHGGKRNEWSPDGELATLNAAANGEELGVSVTTDVAEPCRGCL